MNAETKWTPGPWTVGTSSGYNVDKIYARDDGIAQMFGLPMHSRVENIDREKYAEQLANARLIAAAPEMAEALQAEEEADRLFDAADEYTHRAEGEGWLNDPTGSMHVTEAWDRARQAREHAKELRRAALSKAGG